MKRYNTKECKVRPHHDTRTHTHTLSTGQPRRTNTLPTPCTESTDRAPRWSKHNRDSLWFIYFYFLTRHKTQKLILCSGWVAAARRAAGVSIYVADTLHSVCVTGMISAHEVMFTERSKPKWKHKEVEQANNYKTYIILQPTHRVTTRWNTDESGGDADNKNRTDVFTQSKQSSWGFCISTELLFFSVVIRYILCSTAFHCSVASIGPLGGLI